MFLSKVKDYVQDSISGMMANSDMEKVVLSAAKATLVVETVATETSRTGGDNSALEDAAARPGCKEQLLKISIKLPEIPVPSAGERTHLVLVVDKSGSMAGNPWGQVQSSLKDILSASVVQTNIKTDLIIYSDNAHTIQYTPTNYETVVSDLKAGGCTNFKAAFNKVNRVVTEAGDGFSRTVVVFMTDGQDTVNPANTLPGMVPKLAQRFQELNKHVILHTVGFSKDHDFTFLRTLAEKGGTSEGMFRYCEPGENKIALKQKLDELFDFILNSNSQTMDVELALAEGNFILGVDKLKSKATLQGQITKDDSAEQTPAVVCVEAETWVQLADPATLPVVSLTVKTTIKRRRHCEAVEIPCEIEKTDFKLLESADEKCSWRLKILLRNVDLLIAKVGKAVSGNGDVSKLQEQVERYQSQISKTRVFGNGVTKSGRETMFEQIKEVQENLDGLQNMIAQYMRDGTQSISLLARAHDMRYQAVFSKNRRQRIMDKRAAKNMMQATTAQSALSSLTVDKQEVQQLSQDAKDFYFCMLSQNSVVDVLLGEDSDDAIGFGLAVKRNEVVLDEPTAMRLQVISGTLVSRTAMLDALQYKIDVSGHLSAHGGFNFYSSPLGVTTIGTGREPINAWLPLYVTKSHWERVKVILKPALGSFCTLDPLGYDYKQMDVLFMVLGCMIGQLSDATAGEHQLKILFAFHRTCAACMVDFDLTEKVAEFLEKFVASPAGRTKDVIPVLYTLVGYLAALPSETSRRVMAINDEDDTGRLKELWVGFVAETLRRAAGGQYRETSLQQINGLVNAILHGTEQGMSAAASGPAESVACNATAEIVRLCLNPGQDELQVADFDPVAGVTVPTVKVEHSPHTDIAMETWAQAECGIIKNKNQAKKVTDAKRMVKKWLDAGEATVRGGNQASTSSAADSGDSEREEFDSSLLTDSMLQVMAKLHQKLSKTAYPNLNALPGCIAFINAWLSRQRNFDEMDQNSGMAPESWIREMKEAVKKVYSCMTEFSQEQLKTEANDVLVVSPELLVATEMDKEAVEVQSTGSGDREPDRVVSSDCKGGKENNGDDSDPERGDDYDSYEEYDSDDEDGLGSARRGTNLVNQSATVTLPLVLHCIDADIDIPLVIRAMFCQAVRFHSNAQARTAITCQQLLDLGDGPNIADSQLDLCHRALQEYKDNARQTIIESVIWRRANHFMLRASTTWAFVGYLMNTYKERGAGFSELVDLLMDPDRTTPVPYLQEKVHVMLTGKHKDCNIIANGNLWLPEKKMAGKFKALLGEDTWLAFEMELRSTVQIHVYRESDIPNRHGHCNSNPYIPNILRVKLGMELLPEKLGGPKTYRAYIKNIKTS